jgi:hypothetical protein
VTQVTSEFYHHVLVRVKASNCRRLKKQKPTNNLGMSLEVYFKNKTEKKERFLVRNKGLPFCKTKPVRIKF